MDESEYAELIASGYEWICPACDHFHNEDAHKDVVTCSKCGTVYQTEPPEHAYA